MEPAPGLQDKACRYWWGAGMGMELGPRQWLGAKGWARLGVWPLHHHQLSCYDPQSGADFANGSRGSGRGRGLPLTL